MRCYSQGRILTAGTTMVIKLSAQPLYERVRDNLAERIAAGEWKPNAAMPNETELAQTIGVSPGTMRKALDLLESEGLVSRKQGRGTFVTDPASPSIAVRYSNFRSSAGERIVGDVVTTDIFEGPADQTERARLQLPPASVIYRLTRVRSYLDRPFLSETIALPAHLFPGLPERNLAKGSVTAIAGAYGILLGNAVETVTAGMASPAASDALKIRQGSLVLVLERIVKTRDGRPAELRRAECLTADAHYKAEMM